VVLAVNKETKITIVADTNLFLQCKALAEIDWLLLFPEVLEIEVIVARVVIGELDRLKNDGSSRRARKARTAVSQFGEMLRSDDAIVIKKTTPHVVMRFAPRAQMRASDHPELDLSMNDDRFVAEAIELRAIGKSPVIITADIGVELTCKELGVRAFAIPEQWRLPPESDATEKELRRLQDESRKQPSIKIFFNDQLGNDVKQLDVVVLEMSSWDDAIKAKVLRAILRKHPMSKVTYDPSPFASLSFGTFSRHDVERYRDDYEDWRRGTEKWLDEIPELLELRGRIFAFELKINNSGQSPGEQLRLDLECSDGILFTHPDWAGNKVSTDKPPRPPRELGPLAHLGNAPFLDKLNELKQETRDPFALYFREEPSEEAGNDNVSVTCESLHPSRTASILVVAAISQDTTAGAISVSLSGRNIPTDSVTLPVRVVKRAYNSSDKELLSLLADPMIVDAVSDA
jgi:hypothetical protein